MKEVSKTIANLAIVESSSQQEAIGLLVDALGYVTSIGNLAAPQAPETTTLPQPKTVMHEATTILCKAGAQSECSQCHKKWTVTNNISNQMKIETFCLSFTPQGHDSAIKPPINLQVIDDSAITDCPVCEGNQTLLLWGRWPESKKGSDSYGDVGSVGEDAV